jgi:dihydrolipoamide dehydrogenase
VKTGADSVTVTVEAAGKTQDITVDRVISAVGIVGNTEGLGLEGTGVNVDRTHVVTDEWCRTGEPASTPIGDLAGPLARPQGQPRRRRLRREDRQPPRRPPDRLVQRPGLHLLPPPGRLRRPRPEAKAKAAGHEVRVGRFPFIGNGKAIAMGEPGGLVKAGVRRQNRRTPRRPHDRRRRSPR